MTSKDQKESWKKEAEQLKKDLKTVPQEIRKRAVPIKFGPAIKKSPLKSVKYKKTSDPDDFLRKQLGL